MHHTSIQNSDNQEHNSIYAIVIYMFRDSEFRQSQKQFEQKKKKIVTCIYQGFNSYTLRVVFTLSINHNYQIIKKV